MFTKLPLIQRSSLLIKFFFKPDIYPEAFFADLNKLPNEIEVEWFRDEGMIIGKVTAGDKYFVTQGKNAEDFIKMVNESLVTVFDIPYDYFDAIVKSRSYKPKPEECKQLDDKSILRNNFGFKKEEMALRLA